MRSWDLFRELLRNTGFYSKKFLVFTLAVIVSGGIYFVWQKTGRSEAIIEYSSNSDSYGSQIKTDIIVSKDGRVTIDGQKNNQALNYHADYDELRVKVVNSPDSSISSFQGVVHLPQATSTAETRQIIYATHGVGSTSYYQVDSQTLYYEAQNISPQSIVTIVAYLPKGMIAPGFTSRLGIFIENFPLKNWLVLAIFLPFISIVVMLIMILKRRYGKVFMIHQPIATPPTKDPPAVIGALVDGTVGAREIAATLVELARRKYLFIVNKGENNFCFGKRKSGDPAAMKDLAPFEQALLSKIFLKSDYRSTMDDVEMRVGRHIFSRKIAKFYLDVYNSATRQGYFVRNPARVHLTYKYLGVGLFFLSFAGLELGAFTGAGPNYSLLFWVGGMVAAFFIIKLAPFMPARAAKGVEALRGWLGFRNYLTSRGRLRSSEVLQGKFEEFLSYAIVLGAEVEWTNRFLAEPFVKPDWYESPEPVLTMEAFVAQFFPFIGYVCDNLARSHEPTVE